MASDHYTPVKPAANAQGQTADADDVNSVSNAVETAFETLEAEVDEINSQGSQYADKAEEWANNPEDQNITGEPAGSYSAKHYSIKSEDSETAAAASASSATSSANSASASASSASNSVTEAAAEAATAEAAADRVTTDFEPNNQSGNYTLVAADAEFKMIRMTGDSDYTLTVPPNVFTTNVLIPVVQTGSGPITIVAGSGVTLNYPADRSLIIEGQNYGVTLHLVSGNTWDVVGQLEAA